MASRLISNVFSKDDDTPTLIDDVAIPMLIGLAIGLASGAVLWMTVVVHFGLMGRLLT